MPPGDSQLCAVQPLLPGSPPEGNTGNCCLIPIGTCLQQMPKQKEKVQMCTVHKDIPLIVLLDSINKTKLKSVVVLE